MDKRTVEQKQAMQNRVKQQNAAILQTTNPTPKVPAESWTIGNQSSTHVESTWAAPTSEVSTIKQSVIQKWDYLPTYLSLNRIREDLTSWKITKEQARSAAYTELTGTQPPVASTSRRTSTPVESPAAWIEEYNKKLWESAALEAEQQKQDYLETVKRAGEISDTQIKDQTTQKDRFLEDQAIDYEAYKYDIKQQLDNVIRNNEAWQLSAKTAAALWGRIGSSAFQQWLAAASAEANRSIDKLQRLEWLQWAQVEREKRRLLEDFSSNIKKITDDFNYSNRALIEGARIDVNSLVEKYGLSSPKLTEALDQIDFDVEERRQAILGNYIANLQSANDLHQSEVQAMYDYQDRYMAQQEQYAKSYAEWSLNKSFSDINSAVENGYITQQNADAIKAEVVTTIIDTLDEISGVPWTWYSMLQDIQTWLERGKTPRQVIWQLTGEAQAIQEQKPFQPAPWVPWLFYRDVGGKIEYSTAPWTNVVQSQTPSGKPYTTVPEQNIVATMQEYTQKYADGAKWPRNWWCWEYVNDYLRSAWVSETSLFLDPIKDKKALINSQTPTVWSIAVMNSPTDPQYGHVGIVKWVDANGNIILKSSNFTGDKTVSTNTVKASSILWYFDPTKAGNVSGITPPTPSEEALFSKWAQYINKKWGLTQQRYDEIAKYKAESVSDPTELQRVAEYIVDTQPRWAGFSNEDAQAFTDAIMKYAARWDANTVYQMFANRILENKNVGPFIYDNQELKKWLDTVRNTFEAFKSSWWNTNVFRDIAERVANYLGTTTDTELAKVNNQLWVLVADYIRAISWTAASDKEVQRLVNNMPSIKNVASFNTTILDNLSNIADNKMKSRLETYLWYNKRIAPKIFPDIYGWWTRVDTSKLRSVIKSTSRKTQMSGSSLMNRLSD